MTNHEHERAIDLITRRGVEDIAAPDTAWLESHLSTCAECAEYAALTDSTGRLLRSVAVTASPALVTATQARLRARATDLQEQRSRMVLIAISFCIGAHVFGASQHGCGGDSAAGWHNMWDSSGDRRTGNSAVSAVARNRDRRLAVGVSSSRYSKAHSCWRWRGSMKEKSDERNQGLSFEANSPLFRRWQGYCSCGVRHYADLPAGARASLCKPFRSTSDAVRWW